MKRNPFKVINSVMLFAVLALLALSALSISKPQAATASQHKTTGIQWIDWSDDLFQTAKKEHRQLFIYASSSWCHWCKKMETETLVNPELVKYVNANYIAAELSADKYLTVLVNYQVADLPSVVIIDADKHVVKKLHGYLSAADLLMYLETDKKQD
jgi:thiol:disulfide interchange protein